MPRGKPEAGKRTIDPANKPGPTPYAPPRKSWSVWVSEEEKSAILRLLAEMRAKKD